MEKQLLSISQLAARTGMCVRTIYNLRKRGLLPFLMVGGRVAFDPDEVYNFLQFNEKRSAKIGKKEPKLRVMIEGHGEGLNHD